MEQLRNLGLLQGLGRLWGNLTGTQRFVTMVFISTSIVVLLLISMMATRPQMSVLFSGLQSEDAGAVVAKLQEKKVAYEIDGTTIKVPEGRVAEMRMSLAGEGLPKGGTVGFELFDKNNIGMTEFAQRINYQRALQGELSRSIDELDGVQESRIHIVMPEKTVFAQDENQPSASVVVKLRPGTSLSAEQVGGIVHLVASAVAGMKPSGVTVVDTSGNELSIAGDDVSGLDPRMSSSQLQLKRTHERQMEHDIQTMLERVLGPNKAVVRVNAKINFDREEQSSETYQPLKGTAGVLTSETQMHESYGGTGKPGAAPVQPSATASASKGNYDRLETTSKYEVSRSTLHVIKAPGQIEKLSVAIMVDGDVDAVKKTAITNAVTMAAGIDLKRGDQITVESMKFDNTAAKTNDAQMQAIASRDTYFSVGKVVLALAVLAGLLFFAKGMFSKVSLTVPSAPVVHELPTAASAANPLQAAQAYDTASPVISQPVAPRLQAPPEEVAQVLRQWMSES